LSSGEISENMAAGTIVGIFSTTDQDIDQIHLYSLADGMGDDDNAMFPFPMMSFRRRPVSISKPRAATRFG